MRFLPAGDSALIVEFGDAIDPALSARVTGLADLIAARHIDGVTDLLPTFRSVMVCYDPLKTCQARLRAAIDGVFAGEGAVEPLRRQWTLPVCYEDEVAPDLAGVARSCGLTEDEVVRRHAGPCYRVYMLGFLPGFAYLGDLDPGLSLPRRNVPRTRVPPGSVAIAQAMTAVYPMESPGGWHLIGTCPVRLFDVAADPPALLAAGDGVRFRPVSLAEWRDIAAAVAAGAFRPEPEAAA